MFFYVDQLAVGFLQTQWNPHKWVILFLLLVFLCALKSWTNTIISVFNKQIECVSLFNDLNDEVEDVADVIKCTLKMSLPRVLALPHVHKSYHKPRRKAKKYLKHTHGLLWSFVELRGYGVNVKFYGMADFCLLSLCDNKNDSVLW